MKECSEDANNNKEIWRRLDVTLYKLSCEMESKRCFGTWIFEKRKGMSKLQAKTNYFCRNPKNADTRLLELINRAISTFQYKIQ